MKAINCQRVKRCLYPVFIIFLSFYQGNILDGVNFHMRGSSINLYIFFKEKIRIEISIPFGVCSDQIMPFSVILTQLEKPVSNAILNSDQFFFNYLFIRVNKIHMQHSTYLGGRMVYRIGNNRFEPDGFVGSVNFAV